MSDDGEEGKREGMERVARNADPHWWACMLESGVQVAIRKQYFSSADIVKWCREHHPNASTHEYKAIGPIMNTLARHEVCQSTQDWVPSTYAINHSRPMRVWWSLIYKGVQLRPKPRKRRLLDPRELGELDE
jgi:hypothetical protein